MFAFADAYKLRPKPVEIEYIILRGDLTYCQENLNRLGRNYYLDVLQAFPDAERTDYIVMILALIPKTRK